MNGELQGKVAIVTGGSSGIGKGTVKRFIEEGARVVIADINAEAGEEVARELGPDVAFCKTDVSQAPDVENAVAYAVSHFGDLDIMFNNAGISDSFTGNSLLDRDFSDFDKIIRVVLLGVILGTKFAARHMVTKGAGSIINTASTGGVEGGPGPPVYRAAKAGVINFTESMSIELGPHMIRVNAISPGPIETPILLNGADLPPEEAKERILATQKSMARKQAIPRLGKPEDIGNAAVFLASARAAQITGHNLVVSGGKADAPAVKSN